MTGKVATLQMSPNGKAGSHATISLNRKTGAFESPVSTKESNPQSSQKSPANRTGPVYRGFGLSASARSPTGRTEGSTNGQPQSPSYKRGGTFGSVKRGLLLKSPEESSSPQPLSATVKTRLEKSQQFKQASKKNGSEMKDTIKNRKELEEKVAILENRIKRLTLEDNIMIKKISETTKKTEKVFTNKKRHQQKLFEKESRKNTQNEDLEKKKEELTQERTQRVEAIRQSQDDMLRIKNDTGNAVRLDNTVSFKQKQENERARSERNNAIIQRIKSLERTNQNLRIEKEESTRTELNNQYTTKMGEERQKTAALESKLQELAQLEEQLFVKLSQTQALHKAKYDELEKTFNLKVTASSMEEGNGLSVSRAKSDTTGLAKAGLGKSLGVMKSATTKSAVVKVAVEEEKGEEEEAAEEEEAVEGEEAAEEEAGEEEAAQEEAAEEEAAEEEAPEEEAAEEEAAEEEEVAEEEAAEEEAAEEEVEYEEEEVEA